MTMVMIASMRIVRLLIHLIDIMVMKVRIMTARCVNAPMVLIATEASGTIASQTVVVVVVGRPHAVLGYVADNAAARQGSDGWRDR